LVSAARIRVIVFRLPILVLAIVVLATGIAGSFHTPALAQEQPQNRGWSLRDLLFPRRSERIATSADVSLRRLGQSSRRVRVTDLSPEGCKVRLPHQPRLGEHLLIKFDGLEVLESEVCWVDGFDVGLRFERPFHPAVFALVAERLKATKE